MADALDLALANFSNMTGVLDLFLGALVHKAIVLVVVHKAIVLVNEKGTKASAATAAVWLVWECPPPV